MATKGKKGQKTLGVYWRADRGEWWIRWTCTLGKKHRESVGPEKEEAKGKRSRHVVKVKAARRAGEHYCPRCFPTATDRPVLFVDVVEDYLRRRDLRARDDDERALRRRKEHARVEYVRARFGTRPVMTITTRDVEAMYLDLRARTVGKGKRERPIAVATVNRYMKLLHAVLRLGQRRGLIATNPASPVQLARENNARNRYLSDEEERALWKALPDWFKPLATTALHTGCRRGELLGLQWKDVDLAGCTLHLRKDKAGNGRWVVINAEAQAAIRAVKRRRGVLASLVFCTPDGKPLGADTFKRYWGAATKAAGLTGLRFHDLRHTFASRLVQRGVSPYIVQQAGGWRTASMMARYAHLDPSTIRAAVGLLVGPVETNGHQNGHQARPGGGVKALSEAVNA